MFIATKPAEYLSGSSAMMIVVFFQQRSSPNNLFCISLSQYPSVAIRMFI